MSTQGPNGKRVETRDEAFVAVQHPATRIGFLDAQAGRKLEHDDIVKRIARETPPRALERIGWRVSLFDAKIDVPLAQVRYEEGRLLVFDIGLKARAWGHPDYPPAAIQRWIYATFAGAPA